MAAQRVRAAVLREADHADEDGIFAGANLTFNVWDGTQRSYVKFEAFLTVSTMVDLHQQIDAVLADLEGRKTR